MGKRFWMEILLKYSSTVKETADPDTFKILKEFSPKFLENHLNETVHAMEASNRKKKGKFDMITGVKDDDVFRHYFIDEDCNGHIEECLVTVSVKTNKDKPLTFDEKLNLLSQWVRTNRVEPKPGDLFNKFDVGKFYAQTLANKDKVFLVEEVIEKGTN